MTYNELAGIAAEYHEHNNKVASIEAKFDEFVTALKESGVTKGLHLEWGEDNAVSFLGKSLRLSFAYSNEVKQGVIVLTNVGDNQPIAEVYIDQYGNIYATKENAKMSHNGGSHTNADSLKLIVAHLFSPIAQPKENKVKLINK